MLKNQLENSKNMHKKLSSYFQKRNLPYHPEKNLSKKNNRMQLSENKKFRMKKVRKTSNNYKGSMREYQIQLKKSLINYKIAKISSALQSNY